MCKICSMCIHKNILFSFFLSLYSLATATATKKKKKNKNKIVGLRLKIFFFSFEIRFFLFYLYPSLSLSLFWFSLFQSYIFFYICQMDGIPLEIYKNIWREVQKKYIKIQNIYDIETHWEKRNLKKCYFRRRFFLKVICIATVLFFCV